MLPGLLLVDNIIDFLLPERSLDVVRERVLFLAVLLELRLGATRDILICHVVEEKKVGPMHSGLPRLLTPGQGNLFLADL